MLAIIKKSSSNLVKNGNPTKSLVFKSISACFSLESDGSLHGRKRSMPSRRTEKTDSPATRTNNHHEAKPSKEDVIKSVESNIIAGEDKSDFGWNWVPPKRDKERSDDEIIPVIDKKLLTFEEVEKALKSLGGKNIVNVPLRAPIDGLKDLVIVTGNSSRHLQVMGNCIVRALKSRNLKQAPGITGIEGNADDDWIVVDCFNFAVSFMLEDTRLAINLEKFHSDSETPALNVSPAAEEVYDRKMDELLAKYPIPDFYDSFNGQRDTKKTGDFHKL